MSIFILDKAEEITGGGDTDINRVMYFLLCISAKKLRFGLVYEMYGDKVIAYFFHRLYTEEKEKVEILRKLLEKSDLVSECMQKFDVKNETIEHIRKNFDYILQNLSFIGQYIYLSVEEYRQDINALNERYEDMKNRIGWKSLDELDKKKEENSMGRNKRFSILATIVLLVVVITPYLILYQTIKAQETRIQELEEKIRRTEAQELKKEMTILEQRIQELERQLEKMKNTLRNI